MAADLNTTLHKDLSLLSTPRRLAAAALLLLPVGSLAEHPGEAPDFDRDVRPILSDRCYACHGPDSQNRQAGLRLDTPDGAHSKTASGAIAVKPGDPDGSAIIARIVSDNQALRMPPAYMGHDRLADAEIVTLRRWVQAGGKYSTHWAFLSPKKAQQPNLSDPNWVKQPLDAFVLSRLDAEGLKPSPEAEPETWLRRASLDLIGLPPTLEERDAFLRDVDTNGEAAYKRAVERLLASPRYGERMAMDWLDVARYADTHGFNNDSSRSMWRWRDWVIEAFNRNLPYDEFIKEQLAGDLLDNPTLDQLIATGFNRNHVINSEGGIIEEEYRVEYVADRVRTVGMAWLGLSVECARCHDHKFDPIEQRDYYRLFAFFNNVPEMGEAGRVANAVPMLSAPTPAQQERIDRLTEQVAALSRSVEDREAGWRWEESHAAKVGRVAAEAERRLPRDAEFLLDCETGSVFDAESGKPAFAPGLAGSACVLSSDESPLETEEQQIELCDEGAFTITLWVNPKAHQEDAPLFSAIDYSPEPASSVHGRGVEVRLAGEEVEFRFSHRYPAYSVTVQSQEAGIRPGQWRHVAVAYQGQLDDAAMRVRAAWVRIFVDGRETATRVLYDDVSLNPPGFDKTFRIGHDNSRAEARFEGSIDEIAVWPRALRLQEISDLFASRALAWAAAELEAGRANKRETAWLRDVILADTNADWRRKREELDSARSRLFELRRNVPTAMVMAEMTEPRQAYMLKRGMYNLPGEEVEPGVPEGLLGSWPEEAPKNRLGLAQWLTKADHPLTSRVVVNRFWQQFFGGGLVKTSEDFGLQGEPPSHPKLLDWLAARFVESGWNVKGLARDIVLSATYRQSSAVSPELAARDPENRLLARGARFRLPAEVIRDQALSLAGLLKNHLGGESVRPYQPDGLYEGIVVGAPYPSTVWHNSEGDGLYRRSLYTFWKRTVPHPTMTVFDAPDREFCTVRRSTTNTPLQALTLLNDPTFVEAARKFAERIIREGGDTAESRVRFAFNVATGRAPDPEKLRITTSVLEEMRASYASDEEAAKDLLSVGASDVDKTVPAAELAAYTALASIVLNLDEVITKS